MAYFYIILKLVSVIESMRFYRIPAGSLIPTIIAGETICSGLGYTIEPQSKEEYFFQLRNVKKLEKLNNHQIELAKTYIFIQTIIFSISS